MLIIVSFINLMFPHLDFRIQTILMFYKKSHSQTECIDNKLYKEISHDLLVRREHYKSHTKIYLLSSS
jgi:hypothetical protein